MNDLHRRIVVKVYDTSVEALQDVLSELPPNSFVTSVSAPPNGDHQRITVRNKVFKEVTEFEPYPTFQASPTSTGWIVDYSEAMEPLPESAKVGYTKSSVEKHFGNIKDFQAGQGIYTDGDGNWVIPFRKGENGYITPEGTYISPEVIAGLPGHTFPSAPSDGGVSIKPARQCDHAWKQHVGLFEAYAFCEKCDIKKEGA